MAEITGFAVNTISKLYVMLDIIEAKDINKMVCDNPERIFAL